MNRKGEMVVSKLVSAFKNTRIVQIMRSIKFKYEQHLHQEKKDKYGYEIIRIIDQIGNECGIDIWVEWGTLLGLIRGGELISHDYDIDFATFFESDESYMALTTRLGEKGFYKTRHFAYKGKIVSETYDYHGTLVDIDYCIHDANEVLLTEYDVGSSTLISKRNGRYYYKQMDVMKYHAPKFTICRAEYKNGTACNVPTDAEKHIEFLYGKDWKTPNPNFDCKKLDNYEIIEADNEFEGWRIM